MSFGEVFKLGLPWMGSEGKLFKWYIHDLEKGKGGGVVHLFRVKPSHKTAITSSKEGIWKAFPQGYKERNPWMQCIPSYEYLTVIIRIMKFLAFKSAQYQLQNASSAFKGSQGQDASWIQLGINFKFYRFSVLQVASQGPFAVRDTHKYGPPKILQPNIE